MAENDTPDLEILLRIAADTAGEEKVRAALRGVTEEARVGGEEQVKSNVKSGESFHFPENRGREFHRLLHQLTEQSPLLGVALRSAISPIGGLFTAGIVAGHLLNEEFKKLHETLKLPGFESGAKLWAGQEKSLMDAAIASQVFEAHLRQLATAETDMKTRTDDAVDAIKRQANAEKQIKDAEEALALARIDAREKLGVDKGGLSEVAAAEARLKVQQDFADKRRALDKKAAEDEITARRKERLDLNQTMLGLQQKLIDDQQAIQDAGEESRLHSLLEHQQKQVEVIRKAAEDTQKHLASVAGATILTPIDLTQKKLMEDQFKILTDSLEVEQERLRRFEEIIPKRIAERQIAGDILKQDQQKLEKQQERIPVLEHELALLGKALEITTKTAEKVDAIKNATRETQAGPTLEKGAEAVAARTREIEERFRERGIGVGRQTGHEIGTALDEALKEFGVGVTDALVPRIQSVIDRAKKDMRAEFDAKLGFAKTGK